MAIAKKTAKKKAAKKAVPKVEAPKQIVLTQEQFDTLESIKNELDSLTDKLLNTFSQSDSNENLKSIGFEIGRIYEGFTEQYNKLYVVVTDVDPNPYVWGLEDDSDDEVYN